MIARRITSVLLAGVILVGLMAPPAQAAEGESIALTPTSKRFALDPGVTNKETLSVINDGTVPYTIRMYARPYIVEGEQYTPVFDKLTPITDAYEWITFEQTEYTLAPGQTIEVPFTVAVPSNAQSGGHYGVIFAETQPPTANQTSVVRKKRVGAILYATVNGDNRAEGSVASKDIPFLQTSAPLRASARINNAGNVDFVTRTSMNVKTVFGTDVFSNERELTVLPATTRKVEYEWTKGSAFGLYNVTLSSTILGKTTTSSQYVLMMPIWVMGVLAAIIIAGIALATRSHLRKKSPRNVRKKSSSRRRR